MSQSGEIPSPGRGFQDSRALGKRGLAAGKTLGILEEASSQMALELIALTRSPFTNALRWN